MKRRFPDHKHQQGQKKEAQGEKARREDEGTEHHQVVPIEDAAGSAAAVFQKEDPERAEEEHTDQVAYIKAYTEQKKLCLSQHPRTVEQTDRQSEEQPQQKDRSGGLVALADERAQGRPVRSTPGRDTAAGELLLGTERHMPAQGEQLEDHVARPDQPEQVEHGKTAEKGRPVQNGKDLRPQQLQQQCGQSRGDAEGQAEQVFPAHGYARFCCRSGHGIDTPIS